MTDNVPWYKISRGMRILALAGLVGSLVLHLCSAQAAIDGHARPQAGGHTPSQAPTVEESPAALKAFIVDVLNSMQSHDDANTSAYISGLVIPDHAEWFLQCFGPTEGPRLEAKYSDLLPQDRYDIRRSLNHLVGGQNKDIELTVSLLSPDPSARLHQAIAAAALRPIQIYEVHGSRPDEKSPTLIGEFIYVSGAFRYISFRVFQALSNAPPMRIRLANITDRQVTQKVPPVYSEEAKAARIEGPVTLHVLIGTDGSVKEVTPTNGDPLLVPAAIAAVRQWKYRPFVLDGEPAEMDTTITLDFHLDAAEAGESPH